MDLLMHMVHRDKTHLHALLAMLLATYLLYLSLGFLEHVLRPALIMAASVPERERVII